MDMAQAILWCTEHDATVHFSSGEVIIQWNGNIIGTGETIIQAVSEAQKMRFQAITVDEQGRVIARRELYARDGTPKQE